MSVHRLHLEAQLRQLEAEEQERARAVRAELAHPIATVPQHRHRVPHRTARVFVFAKDGRSLCAEYLLGWWKRRSSFNGRARPVSTNEINRLAAILRRLE